MTTIEIYQDSPNWVAVCREHNHEGRGETPELAIQFLLTAFTTEGIAFDPTPGTDPYVREVQRLRNEIKAALGELGVPQPESPAPVAAAVEILDKALSFNSPSVPSKKFIIGRYGPDMNHEGDTILDPENPKKEIQVIAFGPRKEDPETFIPANFKTGRPSLSVGEVASVTYYLQPVNPEHPEGAQAYIRKEPWVKEKSKNG